MAEWVGYLIFVSWFVVGAVGLCLAMRFDEDLDLVDICFFGLTGAVFGPISWVIWLCEWHGAREEPLVILKRKRSGPVDDPDLEV